MRKLLPLLFICSLLACDQAPLAQSSTPAKKSTAALEAAKESDPGKALERELSELSLRKPWTGDLDKMREMRVIRVLTVYGLGRYYLDRGQEKGAAYDQFKRFESFINEKFGSGHIRIHVAFVPVSRDQLVPALLAGRGDIIAAGLTITDERLQQVDFSDPVSRPLSEILVTGPGAQSIKAIEDLAGQQVYVRKSSSYYASVVSLNESLRQQGLEPVQIEPIAEQLEDEDILEMVSSELLPWAIVDAYKADIWAPVFQNLTPRKDLVFRKGGRIAYAVRKNSPQLLAVLNEFVKDHKQGTLHGNILINRYLKDFDYAKKALDREDYARFERVAGIFREYGEQYGIDYLMAAAQGYQESRLDQSARSAAGAIGIMQLLPTTAADPNVGIEDITNAEQNIHAGVKYLRFIRDRYFTDTEMDKFNQAMFAFAAYNAGPARVRGMRKQAAEAGYDPNVWFDNVEIIAAKEIGRETVQYVANILKYYIAYTLSTRQYMIRSQAREDAGISPRQ